MIKEAVLKYSHVISDEASQRSDGQIVGEDDDAVLELVVQSGRSEQEDTPEDR